MHGTATWLVQELLRVALINEIDEFIRVGVKSSIEDWILDDVHGVCNFLRLKQVPSSLKGINGYQKLLDLYNKARKTDKKGYVNALDMSAIRNKRQDVLAPFRVYSDKNN